jgi:hypothetical protein
MDIDGSRSRVIVLIDSLKAHDAAALDASARPRLSSKESRSTSCDDPGSRAEASRPLKLNERQKLA